MNPHRKGNLLVIVIIAIIAFGTSNIVASMSDGEVILNLLNISTNESTKLVSVDDGNFTAQYINKIIIQTNNTTNTNNTNNANPINRTKPINNDETYTNY
ncbi:MAG: hypothetical protein LBM26_05400 [Methanobrevibacter sp.]|jgi:hypothetical protein|nr:hypothetical protein [Methanobrevibacter sp.]